MTPDRIISIRTDYGDSQEGFARRVRVSRNTVWNWEHGVSTPSSLALDRLLYLERVVRRRLAVTQ